MKVKQIRRIEGKQPVYDVVNVQPAHNFFILPSGGHPLAVHNCGIVDEIEFYKGADPKFELNKIMSVYRAVKRRMESRFMQQGMTPGVLFLVSSKKAEMSFLEQYIKRNKDNPRTLIIDEPIWRVKPPEKTGYSGKKFPVAVGSRDIPTRILKDEEEAKAYEKSGYTVVRVPIEHYDAFSLDPNSALTDIAGIAVGSSMKYISEERYYSCVDPNRPNPFVTETITMSLDDRKDIINFLEFKKIDPVLYQAPAFAHIDTGLTGDLAGIAVVVPDSYVNVKRLEEGQVFETRDVLYKLCLAITIKAELGSEIPFYKIREFIYYLRDEMGVDLRVVTADGYQSRDMIQQFKLRDFESFVLSVDKDTVPYNTWRMSMVEGRFITFPHELLAWEATELEEDKVKGKIDHPEGGSKDLSDAVAGAVHNAFTHKETVNIVDQGMDTSDVVDVISEGLQDEAGDFESNFIESTIGKRGSRIIEKGSDLRRAMKDKEALSDVEEDPLDPEAGGKDEQRLDDKGKIFYRNGRRVYMDEDRNIVELDTDDDIFDF